MSFVSCIVRPKNVRFAILREDFIELCEGNKCAAMLISYFEYWHNHKLAESMQRGSMASRGETIYEPKESDLYQYQSIKEMELGILGEYKYATISDAVDYLISMGILRVIDKHNHIKNRARKYLFVPDVVNDFITGQGERPSKMMNTNIKDHLPSVNRTSPSEKSSLPSENGPAEAGPQPRFVRRQKKETIFPNSLVEGIFLHWNSLDYPLQRHKIDKSSKTFLDSCNAISKALKKHSSDEIKQAMTNYHIILLAKDTTLSLSGIGHRVPLYEFFQFTRRTEDAMLTSRNPLTIDSWFDACLQGMDFLTKEFGKYERDEYPKVTEEIKKSYSTKVSGRNFTVSDVNCFIRSARFIVEYHKENMNKINWNSCLNEKNNPMLFARRLIDAVIDDTKGDVTLIEPTWLCSPRTMTSRFPKYLRKHGLLDADALKPKPAKLEKRGYDPGYKPGELE